MKNQKSVFSSLEMIENRISDKLTVEMIASSIYFSKYHYGRLFREIVGDTVMEYVTKRRLTLAGEELIKTNSTVLDIALKFGYDTHEGFTRSFKSYMGVTPTEYRKYNLTAISQKTVKGKCMMTYSKITDEMIRELNNFIANARELAEAARKKEVLEYAPVWNTIADATDAYAERVKDVLERIYNMAERPDEIINRFTIIKTVEDIAFGSNLLALNVGLMVSRGQPEQMQMKWHMYEKYAELAQASLLKVSKVAQFLNELSLLIFKDMRKSAAEKIQAVIEKGNAAYECINGYDYIKIEVKNVVHGISELSLADISVSHLEGYLFRLNIISFAADMDVLRSPNNKAVFDKMTAFKESLCEALEFFQSLILPEHDQVIENDIRKQFMDMAFQGNILLFYTRGEISNEKLGCVLDAEQKSSFNEICGKINNFISFAHEATEKTAYQEIANRLYEINADLTVQADLLKEQGGAVRFLAGEFKQFGDRVMNFVEG